MSLEGEKQPVGSVERTSVGGGHEVDRVGNGQNVNGKVPVEAQATSVTSIPGNLAVVKKSSEEGEHM